MRSHTFICGCGHSGTSLLAAMFAAHPKVWVPLVETRAFCRRDRAAARGALASEAAASGRAHFAEKTPRHLFHLDAIRSLVPGARFLLLVRDGRDVAASFVKRYGSAQVGLRRWIEDNRVTVAEADAADVAVVRYEDLVAAPEAELRRVCAFAGPPFAPEMLRYHETPRLWFGVAALEPGTGEEGLQHRLLRNWQINQPIFDGRGRWRDELAADDLAPFESGEARALLSRFGYA